MAASDNYIALLNERTQKTGWTWRFELVGTEGPDHSRIFTVRAVVNNKHYPDGIGRNKKEARQNAAKNALSLLQEEEPASSETSRCSPDGLAKLTQANYTCWLNEYSQKMRLYFKEVVSTNISLDSNNQFQYACKFVCGDKEYPTAVSRGKREAKEEAAKLVYKEIHEENNTEVPGEKTNEAQQPSMISDLSSSLAGLTLSPGHSESAGLDNNFIGFLNHYCQKNGQACDFKLVAKIGPPHNPEFVYKVIINKKEYPEGRGKSAKQAQQRAAELACHALQGSDGNSQTFSTSCDSKDESSSLASTLSVDTSSRTPPISQDSSYSIVFKDSSAHLPSPAPVQSPQDAKNKESKIRLAANFPNSPNVKQDKPTIINKPKPSAGSQASNSTVRSNFVANFHSISKLGKGGFGRVFKATNNFDKKDYAVKIVKYTGKACREVGALADLMHSNIVRYHTSWIEETAYRCESSESSTSTSSSEGDFLYIQMELCEGDTLQVWIETKNAVIPYLARRLEAVEIMTQVLEAVKYIHSKNLIHRDLKPANIMFGKEDVVKVGDFGLVTAAEADCDRALLERTNRTGTRSYMSPEQESQSSYDKKVDIFPLGLIYFELLWNMETGHERGKIWKDVRSSKKLPEGFSRKFVFENKLIEQMLSASPEERPDASDLLTKLDTFRKRVLRPDQNTKNENRTY